MATEVDPRSPTAPRPLPQEQRRPSTRDQFTPSGVASETAAVAKALGSCVLDAPELQMKLVVSLKAQDHQRRCQQSGTLGALVVEAVLALSCQEREHAFTREIADEVNRLLEIVKSGVWLYAGSVPSEVWIVRAVKLQTV